ncbi:MAG: hypothetical protein ABSF69_17750 [Polyangiaceae bacterium]|jgi:uncharacterized protein DUF6941
MPRLEYFLVAESLAIDALTNRVSIFNVLEEVVMPSFPSALPTVTAIACWYAEPGENPERDFQASYVAHVQGELDRQYDVNFRLPQRRARTYIQLQGFPAQRPGELIFELRLNGEHVAEHRITVALALTAEAPIVGRSNS